MAGKKNRGGKKHHHQHQHQHDEGEKDVPASVTAANASNNASAAQQDDYVDASQDYDEDTSFLHLNLAPAQGTDASFTVSVGPVVYFSILDHHIRRSEDLPRVVGVLLGVRSEDGSEVEVKNCFPLAHTEVDDMLGIEQEYLQQMYALHQRVNSKEAIVGWYSTGNSVSPKDVACHEYFSAETYPHPTVHLLVDTALTAGKMATRAYISSPVGLPNTEMLGSLFVQIPCEVKLSEGERSGLDVISMAKSGGRATLLSDMDNLERSITLIQEMLDIVSDYVAKVQNGTIDANNAIGRFLMDTIASIPRIDSAEFEKMFSSHLQDLLMVIYLSNLTRTQLAIAQRLQNLVHVDK